MSYEIFFDGAAVPNPGETGYGFLAKHSGSIIHAQGGYLGEQTNNFAEFAALYFALKYSVENKLDDLKIYGDSDLVIRIMNLEWRCKNSNLKPIFKDCRELTAKIGKISFHWIPREQNEQADEISKLAVQKKEKLFLHTFKEELKFNPNLHKL